jgi:EF-P beta-lysylation protein EpmB
MAILSSPADPARRAPTVAESPDWRTAIEDSVTDPSELCRLLDLPKATAARASQAHEHFGLLVPRSYLGRIQPADPEAPLLLQVLPRREELDQRPGFTDDPVGESGSAQRCGLLWKYRGRALILATGACAVHCRFCFRRHFPRLDWSKAPERWEPALNRIAAEPSLHEVILSGGDPLVLEDDLLAWLVQRLARIGHLRRLRVHTRVPILIPQRVTGELLDWLTGTRLTPIVAVHVNHPAEIDQTVAAAIGRLVDAGVPVLSQSVLLREVNDRVDVLVELFERLVDVRVMPYYLHQLDRVAGAAHFEVPELEGAKLIEKLRARLPGYAVPRYVRELPGRPGKHVLAW